MRQKSAKRDMPPFLEQDRPEKVKEIYRALKREYGESMPAEVKARIAARKGKRSPEARESGPPYKAPLRYKRKGSRYVKKSALATCAVVLLGSLLGQQ